MKSFKIDCISKYRTYLMGYGTLAIVISHMFSINVFYSEKNLFWFFDRACAFFTSPGVDFFLILSGIGLYFSLSNSNANYSRKMSIKLFYKKRIVRLLIPYFIIAIPGWIILDRVNVFYHLSTLTFLLYGNDGTWYISFTIFLYLIFPFIYYSIFYECDTNQKESDIRIILVIILSVLIIILIDFICFMISKHKYETLFWVNTCIGRWEIAIGRFPAFLIGCWFGKIIKSEKKLSFWFLLLCLLLTPIKFIFKYFVKSVPFGSMMFPYRICVTARSILMLFFITWLFWIVEKLKTNNDVVTNKYSFQKMIYSFINFVFSFYGKHSLEIYLIHIFMINWIKSRFLAEQYIGQWWIVIPVLGLASIGAFFVEKINCIVWNLIGKRKVKL